MVAQTSEKVYVAAPPVEFGETLCGSRMSNEVEVAHLINDASKVVVLTGAGISTDSGIPTFRGADGYWTVGSENYAPEALSTWNMYDKMPAELWRWYQYKWGKCRRALPNVGHHALVRLDNILGGAVTIVTQNVDGLHLAAGSNPSRLYEVHGRLAHMRCDERVEGSCLHGVDLHDPAVSELARATVVDTPMAADDEVDEQLPVCQKCGVRMRPKVLWFDENYNEPFFSATSAFDAVEDCDVLIVIGTQLSTALPQSIVAQACANGAVLVRIDPVCDWMVPDYLPFLHIQKRSTEALVGITACLERLRSANLQGPPLAGSLAMPESRKDELEGHGPTERCFSYLGHSRGFRVRFEEEYSDPSIEFDFQTQGDKIHFRVTVESTGSREACAILAQACYSKLEGGCTEPEVIAFRDECCSRMRKGRRRLTRKVWAPHYEVTALQAKSPAPILSPGLWCAPPSPDSTDSTVEPTSASEPSSPSLDLDDCPDACTDTCCSPMFQDRKRSTRKVCAPQLKSPKLQVRSPVPAFLPIKGSAAALDLDDWPEVAVIELSRTMATSAPTTPIQTPRSAAPETPARVTPKRTPRRLYSARADTLQGTKSTSKKRPASCHAAACSRPKRANCRT